MEKGKESPYTDRCQTCPKQRVVFKNMGMTLKKKVQNVHIFLHQKSPLSAFDSVHVTSDVALVLHWCLGSSLVLVSFNDFGVHVISDAAVVSVTL